MSREPTNETAEAEPEPNRGKDLALPAFGVLLVLIWFIPDLLGSPVVWSFQSITRMEGPAVIAALTPPIGGALLLLLFAASGVWNKAYLGGFFVGAFASFTLLEFGKPAFVFGPGPTLTLALLCLGMGVYLRRRYPKQLFFFASIALLPAALLGYALWAVIDGRYPAAYLSPLKLPVALFASLSVTGISIVRHFRK